MAFFEADACDSCYYSSAEEYSDCSDMETECGEKAFGLSEEQYTKMLQGIALAKADIAILKCYANGRLPERQWMRERLAVLLGVAVPSVPVVSS